MLIMVRQVSSYLNSEIQIINLILSDMCKTHGRRWSGSLLHTATGGHDVSFVVAYTVLQQNRHTYCPTRTPEQPHKLCDQCVNCLSLGRLVYDTHSNNESSFYKLMLAHLVDCDPENSPDQTYQRSCYDFAESKRKSVAVCLIHIFYFVKNFV